MPTAAAPPNLLVRERAVCTRDRSEGWPPRRSPAIRGATVTRRLGIDCGLGSPASPAEPRGIHQLAVHGRGVGGLWIAEEAAEGVRVAREQLVRAAVEKRLAGLQVDQYASGVEKDNACAGNVIGLVKAEHEFRAVLE